MAREHQTFTAADDPPGEDVSVILRRSRLHFMREAERYEAIARAEGQDVIAGQFAAYIRLVRAAIDVTP